MEGAGLTWTDIGNVIENYQDGKYTEAEMQEAIRAAAAVNPDQRWKKTTLTFLDLDGNPAWSDVIEFCRKHEHKLDPRNQEFLTSVATQVVYRQLSLKQQEWLRSIFLRVGGRF